MNKTKQPELRNATNRQDGFEIFGNEQQEKLDDRPIELSHLEKNKQVERICAINYKTVWIEVWSEPGVWKRKPKQKMAKFLISE